MELHITRHENPQETEEIQNQTDTMDIGFPTLDVDETIIPQNLKPLEKQMTLMAEFLVEQALEKHLPKILAHMKKEAKELEDKTLTHTTQTIAQVQKKFAASIEEMVEEDLLPKMTKEEVKVLSTLLQGNEEAQTLQDTLVKRIQTLRKNQSLEDKARYLRQKSWDVSKYSQQDVIRSLCELVNKYLPVQTEEATQSSLGETETFFTGGRVEDMTKTKKTSDKDAYLQNTPVYRAVLLFRAAKIECDSLALCGTCPFKSKGDECRMWKQAFALHDIAFYRAQSISQSQYEHTIEQKLAEATIELSSLKQQLSEEQIKSKDLQDKLDKLAQGSKHLTTAKNKHSEETDYETELDPYLRFR
jgi:hypothetical protein